MKSLFVLCAVIALAYGWNIPEEEEKPVRVNSPFYRCVKKSGLLPSHIGKVYRFEYPDTEDVHRFLNCVAKMFSLWDDESGLQENVIREILDGHEKRDEILKEAEECNSIGKSDNSNKWLYNDVVCVINGKMGEEVKAVIKLADKMYPVFL